MKTDEMKMGFANYKNREYPFIYENGILKLMPSSVEVWKKEKHELLLSMSRLFSESKENEWIDMLQISANTHEEKRIEFIVSEAPSNNNGFISFQVLYYFEYNENIMNLDSIYGICVSGREIDYFYNPGNAFETEIQYDENGIISTNVKVTPSEELEVGEYKYLDSEIKIGISTIPKYYKKSEKPLSANSKIKFKFSKAENLDFAISIFNHCKRFLYYICGRTNIQLGDIVVYTSEGDKLRQGGTIHICSNNNSNELDLNKQNRIIKYDYIKDKMCVLFSEIATGTMYFEHIRQSINDTRSFGVDRIILNFVAFEREFRNLYDDTIVRSNEYNEIKENILTFLNQLQGETTGKKKKYVKGFIKTFTKAENKYADRMEKALVDCEEILLPFLKHDYNNYNSEMIGDICDRMNTLRNDSAHGNIDLEINPINIFDFATLENLLYAMRLKKLGVDLLNIRCAIKDLKYYTDCDIYEEK